MPEIPEMIEINLLRLSAAYVFLLILLVMVRRQGIGQEKEILIASLRMTVQLVMVGYVLVFVLDQRHFLFSLLALAVMETFAVRNIFARLGAKLSKSLRRVIVFAMLGGTLTSLSYFLLVVLNLIPWYDARYFIPLAGMIIGNSMTGVALGADRLLDGMKNRKGQVEAALMLGASPREATKIIVNDAFATAILPTVNSMVGMGIVFLPGMMSGQIIAGISPLTAISYQIAIMMGILGGVSLAVFMMVKFGYRTFFNTREQLSTVD